MTDARFCGAIAKLEGREGERNGGPGEYRGCYEYVTVNEVCSCILPI